jgi:hypothetical protein
MRRLTIAGSLRFTDLAVFAVMLSRTGIVIEFNIDRTSNRYVIRIL